MTSGTYFHLTAEQQGLIKALIKVKYALRDLNNVIEDNEELAEHFAGFDFDDFFPEVKAKLDKWVNETIHNVEHSIRIN